MIYSPSRSCTFSRNATPCCFLQDFPETCRKTTAVLNIERSLQHRPGPPKILEKSSTFSGESRGFFQDFWWTRTMLEGSFDIQNSGCFPTSFRKILEKATWGCIPGESARPRGGINHSVVIESGESYCCRSGGG